MIYIIEKKTDSQEELQRVFENALGKDTLTSEQISELHRLRASYFLKQAKFEKYEEIYNSAIQSLESHQTHYKSWYFWLLFCIQCQRLTNKNQGYKWIENGIKSLPYALRYKSNWLKIAFIDILKHLEKTDLMESKDKIAEILIDDIPIWAWTIWTPNLLTYLVKCGSQIKLDQSLVIFSFFEFVIFIIL